MISTFELAKKIVGKEENAGIKQHFLLSRQMFQKPSSQGQLTLSQTSPAFYVSAGQVF